MNQDFLTEANKLLLRASFLPASPSLLAWQKWQEKVDIENLDSNSYYLLGFLYRNLSNQNVNDSEMGRLKGIYKRAWYGNQILLKNLSLILQAFQDAGIKIILSGDVILATIYDREYSGKTIKNYQFLLHPQDTSKAVNCLQKLDWIFPIQELNNDLCTLSRIDAYNAEHQHLSLYPHLFRAMPQDYTDNQLWQWAIPSKIADFHLKVLSPTDQLLLTCQQGFSQKSQSLLINLADALSIINNSIQEIDWIRLIAQAQRYEVILPLRNMLTLLENICEITLPDWVLPSLRKMAISHGELLEYQVLPEEQLLSLKAHLLKSWYFLRYYKNKISRLLRRNEI
jgi:predicted nucleotidyltransferase